MKLRDTTQPTIKITMTAPTLRDLTHLLNALTIQLGAYNIINTGDEAVKHEHGVTINNIEIVAESLQSYNH